MATDTKKKRKAFTYDKTKLFSSIDSNAVTNWCKTEIKVDRQFTDPRSQYFLSVVELYIFIIISMDKRKDGSIFTCLHMIEQNMPLPLFKRHDDNRMAIINALKGLSEKNIIKISNSIDYQKPYCTFYIRINYEEFEGKDDDSKWRGFNPITLNIVKKIKRIEHLYMYCTINGYDNSDYGGFKCSYSEWSKILGRSVSSVKRYVKEVSDEGYELIFVNSGEYLKGVNLRQDVNTYRTKEFGNIEKTYRTIVKESKGMRNDLRKPGFGEENPF